MKKFETTLFAKVEIVKDRTNYKSAPYAYTYLETFYKDGDEIKSCKGKFYFPHEDYKSLKNAKEHDEIIKFDYAFDYSIKRENCIGVCIANTLDLLGVSDEEEIANEIPELLNVIGTISKVEKKENNSYYFILSIKNRGKIWCYYNDALGYDFIPEEKAVVSLSLIPSFRKKKESGEYFIYTVTKINGKEKREEKALKEDSRQIPCDSNDNLQGDEKADELDDSLPIFSLTEEMEEGYKEFLERQGKKASDFTPDSEPNYVEAPETPLIEDDEEDMESLGLNENLPEEDEEEGDGLFADLIEDKERREKEERTRIFNELKEALEEKEEAKESQEDIKTESEPAPEIRLNGKEEHSECLCNIKKSITKEELIREIIQSNNKIIDSNNKTLESNNKVLESNNKLIELLLKCKC